MCNDYTDGSDERNCLKLGIMIVPVVVGIVAA